MRREKEIELPKNTRGARARKLFPIRVITETKQISFLMHVAVHFTVGDADRDVVINGTGSVRRQESH